MLQSLSIQQIVLIDSLEIEFSSGLCVFTGETGAGKSIILDALGCVLGSRINSKLLRHGAEQGSVHAVFTPSPAVIACIKDHDIPVEDEVMIRRVIFANGKNKAYINDTQVSIQFLKTVGDALVELHGQHDQRGLLNRNTHKDALDHYGKLTALRMEVAQLFAAWRQAKEDLHQLHVEQQKAVEEEEYLRHVYGELSLLAPETGEEEMLADRRTLLMQKEKIVTTIQSAHAEFTQKQQVGDALYQAQRILMRQSAGEARGFEEVIDVLDRASNEVAEASRLLDMLLEEVQGEEWVLNDIEERLFSLRAAARKYRIEVDALPEYQQHVAKQLALIENQSADITKLTTYVAEAKQRFYEAAETLSAKRAIHARTLEEAMHQELAPLKMEQTRFEVAIIREEEENGWNETGIDQVAFNASTNPGQPMAELTTIASGGELSRFMLALKVVLSDNEALSTLIFDEIDTGIGGAVADAVGRRLARLAKDIQVLVITHQPQVAARADLHLKVVKAHHDNHTTTQLAPLSLEQRKEELARMLSGHTISPEALAAADKLMVS